MPTTLTSQLRLAAIFRPAIIVAILAALAFLFLISASSAHAKGDPENAALEDLANRTGVSTGELDVARLAAVTWNDACLGLAADDEACAQALTDGWVIWLNDGASLIRYHTNLDGSSLRSVAATVGLADLLEAPLPTGATPRPLTRPDTSQDLPDAFAGATTVTEFLAALELTGLPTALQEIAILRPEIGVPSAGQISLDTATIELFDLGSFAAGEELINALRDDSTVLAANATYWVSGQIAVVLTNAPANSEVEQTLSGIVGSPVLLTIASPPLLPLPPGADGDDAAQSDVVDQDASEAAPEALPSTGLAGVDADQSSSSVWIWVGVATGAVAIAAIAAAAFRRRPLTR
jgi:hypothetical protein